MSKTKGWGQMVEAKQTGLNHTSYLSRRFFFCSPYPVFVLPDLFFTLAPCFMKTSKGTQHTPAEGHVGTGFFVTV